MQVLQLLIEKRKVTKKFLKLDKKKIIYNINKNPN